MKEEINMEDEIKRDEVMRKEFARIFDWQKPREQYGYNREIEYRIPTWAEVFVKVGRLLQVRDDASLEERLESLENMVRTNIQDLTD